MLSILRDFSKQGCTELSLLRMRRIRIYELQGAKLNALTYAHVYFAYGFAYRRPRMAEDGVRHLAFTTPLCRVEFAISQSERHCCYIDHGGFDVEKIAALRICGRRGFRMGLRASTSHRLQRWGFQRATK